MDKKVEYLKEQDIEKYIEFLNKVFDYETTKSAIETLIKKDKVLIVKKEEKIIASVILEERFEYVKNQKYYYLGYFGVLKEYRRMGYATKIFQRIEELVQENNIKYLELTSGNHRKAAHYFYKNNDFKIKDTTVFVKLY